MTLTQLIARLKSASSFFSLSGLEPADMGSALDEVSHRLTMTEVRLAKLETVVTKPPFDPADGGQKS